MKIFYTIESELKNEIANARKSNNFKRVLMAQHKLACVEYMHTQAPSITFLSICAESDESNYPKTCKVFVRFHLFGKIQSITFSSFETFEHETGEQVFSIS